MGAGKGTSKRVMSKETESLINNGEFGLSTGWDVVTRQNFGAAIEAARLFSPGAIELSALSTNDIPVLIEFLNNVQNRAELQNFKHVSVHGPAKHLDGNWGQIIANLQQLPPEVARIILHPDTLGKNIGLFKVLGSKLVLENMDCRKDSCRTAAEMQRVFESLPEAGFCLDVAHAWTIDPSLEVGQELLNHYGDRLVEVHLSGIESNGKHRITTPEDLKLYDPLLKRCHGIPWIFESPLVS